MILIEISRAYSESQPYLELLYTSVFLLAYYGLLRIGEITESPHVIKAKDVHKITNDPTKQKNDKLLLILYSSKTHNLGQKPQKIRIMGRNGIKVESSLGNGESTSNERNSKGFYCPVDQTKAFINMRNARNSDLEQFFIFQDGSNLKSHHVREVLNTCLRRLKLDPKLYDVHSFRIGRATDLEKLKCPIEQIKRLGRWKSNAVYKYLRYH